MQLVHQDRFPDLIRRPSGQRERLLHADEFNFSATALAPGSRQRPALANDPNPVALDSDASDSFARQAAGPLLSRAPKP